MRRRGSVTSLKVEADQWWEAFRKNQPADVPPTAEIHQAQEIDFETCRIQNVSKGLVGEDSDYYGIKLSDPALRETQIITALRAELAAGLKRSYLLLGGTGCGKSFGAIALITEIAEGGGRCKRIHAFKLAQMVNRREFDALEKLEDKKYLILEDLGAEPDGFKGSDFLAQLDYLVNERYERKLMTIITSNMSRKDIGPRYGDRFVSRFKSSGLVIESTDPDYRVPS